MKYALKCQQIFFKFACQSHLIYLWKMQVTTCWPGSWPTSWFAKCPLSTKLRDGGHFPLRDGSGRQGGRHSGPDSKICCKNQQSWLICSQLFLFSILCSCVCFCLIGGLKKSLRYKILKGLNLWGKFKDLLFPRFWPYLNILIFN